MKKHCRTNGLAVAIAASSAVAILGTALPSTAHAAATWTPSVLLQGPLRCVPSGAVAIDDAGDTFAAWDHCIDKGNGQRLFPIYATTRPVGATWQTPVTVASRASQAYAFGPTLRSTAGGFLTMVWADSTAIWAADKAPGKAWGAPQAIGPACRTCRRAISPTSCST